jgi:alpha-beta hydrolase superfamily lysophospholipase
MRSLDMPQPAFETLTFDSGGYRLKGALHLPAGPCQALVIGSHGLLATSDSPKQLALAKRCSASQVAYFRFDHRGCGKSEGVFEKVTSLPARCEDLKNAIRLVQPLLQAHLPLGLFGSSMGAAVCLAVAAETEVSAIITFAAPLCSDCIQPLPTLSPPDAIQPLISNRPNLTFDIRRQLAGIKCLLVIHGDADRVVPVSNARLLYKKAGHPKKLVILRNGDHRMSQISHQAQFLEEALNWFKISFKLNA